jgi:hypothetical protein
MKEKLSNRTPDEAHFYQRLAVTTKPFWQEKQYEVEELLRQKPDISNDDNN